MHGAGSPRSREVHDRAPPGIVGCRSGTKAQQFSRAWSNMEGQWQCGHTGDCSSTVKLIPDSIPEILPTQSRQLPLVCLSSPEVICSSGSREQPLCISMLWKCFSAELLTFAETPVAEFLVNKPLLNSNHGACSLGTSLSIRHADVWQKPTLSPRGLSLSVFPQDPSGCIVHCGLV